MTIVAVRTHRVSSPLHTPFVTALRRTTTADSLLVEIVDSDGRSGFGEAPQVWAVTGANIPGSQAAIEEMIGPKLIGKDPDDLNARCREVAAAVVGNEAAKAAADTALHDLVARRQNVTLAQLLGGTTTVVPTDVTLAAGEPAELTTAAKARLGEGFTTLKLKVGTDPATDLDRIKAVCEVDGAIIRLDANQGWTAREAIKIINAISELKLPVQLVEQPVKRADLAGLAQVTRNVDIPVMADESVFSLRDLSAVIEHQAADLVNVKLAKCGGLSTARVMLELAAAHGLGTCVGSMMEGPVGLGAAASLVAAFPTTVISDLDAAWWLSESPVRGGLRYENGTVVLPGTGGLGIEL